MNVEVEVFSLVNIKPSSPTPPHLKTYKLSFLDQMAPKFFTPFILFYESNNDNELSNLAKSKRLQASLSDTLTRFYPLAGRATDNFLIDCNDKGVPFLEARVKCRLSNVVHDPSPGSFSKFLPHELDAISDKVMAIQANFFECGGMALTVCINHIISDAFSNLMFISSWSAICRGDHKKIICPQFESAKLFPSRDLSGHGPQLQLSKEKIVVRRFCFKNSEIKALVDKYANKNSDMLIRPTRVMALSVLIWSRHAAAIRDKVEPEGVFFIVHGVNLRSKMNPPLPQNSFGNYVLFVYTPTAMDPSSEYGELVKKIQDSMKDLDDSNLANLKSGKRHQINLKVKMAEAHKKGLFLSLNFSSWCNFPVYDNTDFGWGKPVRVGFSRFPVKNAVIFMDTREGDGIDAWVNMVEEDMAKFEVDKELLANVSPCGVSRY